MIYTDEQWTKDGDFKAKAGQEIEYSIYNQMLNVLPPKTAPFEILNSRNDIVAGFLMGEAYCHDDNGRAMYMAFGRASDGKCYYLGLSHAYRK